MNPGLLSRFILASTLVICFSGLHADSAKLFLITGHGAIADGATLNTAAIQQTIDAAAAAGGGTVVIPKGAFLSGAIFLKSGVNLHLDEGAVLKGSDNIADYPIQDTRIEGRINKWAVALVNATGTDGLRISGAGAIDGSGLKFWEAFWQRRKENPNCTNLEVVRPRMIHIRDAKDVKVSGLQLRNSGFWTMHFFQCDGVLVEKMRIVNPMKPVRAPSTDGIDIDSCRNVTVRDSYLAVDDDCIAIKCGKGPKAHEENRPVENVTVENCEFGYGHGVLTLGSEATTVRNVVFRNCKVAGENHLVRFKLRPDTKQLYENITYENITVDGKGGEVFDIRPWKQFYDPQGMPPQNAIVRHIRLRNISATGLASAGAVKGNPGDTLEDFEIENVKIEAKDARWNRAPIKGLTVKNFTINGKAANMEAATETDDSSYTPQGVTPGK
jgi:polygalacturonase